MPSLAGLEKSLGVFANQVLHATGTPGLSVAVATPKGKMTCAFGYADLENFTAMTPDHTFYGGSISKPLAAAALLLAQERNHLRLDVPATPFLDSRIAVPDGVTGAHLLTHTAGLRLDSYHASTTMSPSDMLTELGRIVGRGVVPQYPGRPRNLWVGGLGQYEYSNLGVALAASMIPTTTGMQYQQFLRRHIFEPLGMRDSEVPEPGHLPGLSLGSRLAKRYASWGPAQIPSPHFHTAVPASVGLITTPADYADFLLSLLPGMSTLLSDASLTAMHHVHATGGFPGDPELGIGLGIELTDWPPRRSFGHEGGYPVGHWTVAWAYPIAQAAVVVAQNRWAPNSYVQPNYRTAAGLVASFIGSYLGGRGHEIPAVAPAFVSGYSAGARMADFIVGVLGCELDEQARAEMSRATLLPSQPATWDADAFRRGLDDFAAVAANPNDMDRYLWNGSAVRPDLMAVHAHAAGATRGNVFGPMSAFG